ncbi:hypothetical protein J0X14_15055 [Muricauda sp. CAU 1633]|uniref:M61 family metallopeptidase n=1 Tax=Allomuricauda sp. CAU 1633 TaxID=2816036 RepID=UPI001A8CF08A|nr:hypothetical protein [Muricauda sp. CAU 1633]MBO0323627.1 hypothetical protein [Muricauda sp. CAU 1633]
MLIFYRLQVVALLLFQFLGFSSSTKIDTNKLAHPTLNNSKATVYTIHWDETHPKLLKVQLTTTLTDQKLFMAHGAGHLPNGWANFIHNLRVTTLDGETVPIEQDDGANWSVKADIGQQIQVAYEYHLDHEDYEWSGGLDGVAYTTNWGNFYAGRTVFVLNGEEQKDIEVVFDIPTSWKVTHPWETNTKVQNSSIAQNQTELTQSMFFIGKHEEFRVQEEGFELIFALGGSSVVSETKIYKDMARGVMDYYTQLMGGLPKTQFKDKVIRSVVIINEAATTDGEVLGNNISIMIKSEGGPMDKMLGKFIFAHEFFHLWNGKSIVPADDRTEWFKEGFSNYYTLKSLRQTNFLDDAGFLNVLNSLFYQRYRTDDGLGKIAMVQGEEKHAHWGLIYAGGLFTAMAQDIMIRKTSENKHSLDDVMKDLYQTYSGTSDTYTLDELKNRLSQLNRADQSDFFKKYVEGAEVIPIDTYLSMGPFNAEIKDGSLLIQPKANLSALDTEILNGFFGKIQSAQ